MPTTQSPIAAIRLAFDNYLELYQSDRVAWEGTIYSPEISRPYIDTKMLALTQRALSVGASGMVEHSGIYQVKVNFPSDGGGLSRILTKADAVANYMARGTNLSVSTGGTLKIEIPQVLPMIEYGDWMSVPIQVRWFYHQL